MVRIIFLCLLTSVAYASNWGHRAGADYYTDLPENSLIVLQKSLNTIQDSAKFLYLEFDVQETFDGKLVIFHDKTFKRMLPNSYDNNEAFESLYKNKDFIERMSKLYNKVPKAKDLKIRDLKLVELKTLYLGGNKDNFQQRVPELNEFLKCSQQHRLIKPMVVEIKYLQTEQARIDLLNEVTIFRTRYVSKTKIIKESKYDFPFEIGFMCFASNWKLSYGSKENRQRWCKKLKDNGFYGMFIPITHWNHCDMKK